LAYDKNIINAGVRSHFTSILEHIIL